jgi:hypothetical protein
MNWRGYIHRTFQGKAQAAGRTEPALNVLLISNGCQIEFADHRVGLATRLSLSAAFSSTSGDRKTPWQRQLLGRGETARGRWPSNAYFQPDAMAGDDCFETASRLRVPLQNFDISPAVSHFIKYHFTSGILFFLRLAPLHIFRRNDEHVHFFSIPIARRRQFHGQ